MELRTFIHEVALGIGMQKLQRRNEKSGHLCRRGKVAAFVKFHQTLIPGGSGVVFT
jgi:hypothetical protein